MAARTRIAGWSFLLLLTGEPLAAQSPPAPISSDAATTRPGERLALLQPACGARYENGCHSCPPGTEFPNDQLNLKGVVYGHFLGPTSDDAAVGFFGCESHASGLGGTLLLSRQNNAWKLVSIRPATIVNDCKKLKTHDGHDVLICFGQDGHQGVIDEYLYLLDFERPWDPQQGLDIFFMVNDSAGSCTLIDRPREGLVSGTIERVSFAQEGRIVVETRLGSITAAQFKAIEKDCLAGDPTPLALRLATVRRTYTFSFNGRTVTPIAGNPPMDNTEAIPPETSALLPSLYTAPDGSFAIPVPYTFTTIRNPRVFLQSGVQRLGADLPASPRRRTNHRLPSRSQKSKQPPRLPASTPSVYPVDPVILSPGPTDIRAG